MQKKRKSIGKLKVVLASRSPRRRQILRELGVRFEVKGTGMIEKIDSKLEPGRTAVLLAISKARAISDDGSLIIAMDTLVVIGRKVLGKPRNRADAIAMLANLSGKTHRVITGVALCYGGKIVSGSETTQVQFRKLSRKEIEWYVDTGEPSDKAGAYAIQGFARIFVSKINGCYFNVIGFPIDRFRKLLSRLGFELEDLRKTGKTPNR
jgi:nucleoside triphosphate pyrophosphatase